MTQVDSVRVNQGVTVETLSVQWNLNDAQQNELKAALEDGKIDENELATIAAAGEFDMSMDDLANDTANFTKVENTDEADGADNANAKIKEQMQQLENENNQLAEDKKAEENKIADAKAEITRLNELLGTETATLEGLKSDYNKTLENLENSNSELNTLVKRIETAVENLEDDMKYQAKRTTINAIAEYDPSSGKSFEEFLEDKMEGVAPDSAELGFINRLGLNIESISSEVKNLCKSLSSLNTQIDNCTNNIKNLQSQITAQNSIIETSTAQMGKIDNNIKVNTDTINTLRTQLDPTEALKERFDISDEECAIIKENNIDLKEKLPDGSPRYVIAKGAIDDKFHVYDMGDPTSSNENGTTYYKSIVREYGCGGGFDVIEMGNGWISKLDNAGSDVQDKNSSWYSGASGSVFHMNDCGEFEAESACYSTASPLSLDLNGDGVKTSNQVVDFDIDGDGVVDKINDSADAVLVFDKDGDGISGVDGSECFGDNTDLDGDGKKDGYKNGFEALLAMAQEEGLVNGSDDMVLDENDLKILEEKRGLKIKTGGYNDEATSLSDAGITEINLSTADTTLEKNFDGNGNELMRQEGATFKVNGETREYADIWHRKLDENEQTTDKNAETTAESSKSSSLEFDLNIDTTRKDMSEINNNIFKANSQSEQALKKAQEILRKYSH